MGQPGVEQSQTLSTHRLLYSSVENEKKIILQEYSKLYNNYDLNIYYIIKWEVHSALMTYCWLAMPWIFLCSCKIWISWFEFSSFVVDQSRTNGTRNHHSWEMTVSFSWTWIWRDETLHVLTWIWRHSWENPSRFRLCFVEHSRELSMRKKRTWWKRKKVIMVKKWARWKGEHVEKGVDDEKVSIMSW